MKLIDEKGRLFGKVSFIDLFAILAVVIIGVFFLQRGLLNSELQENVGEEKTIQVTVFIPDLTEEQINVLEESSGRLQKTGRNADVNVLDIELEEAIELVETKEGEIKEAKKPNRYDAKILVEGIGEVMENKINIGNIEIKIGTDIRLMTKYFEGLGVVFNIED